MTVEIGILNKEAVAIAADSAVTFSRGDKKKIFTSANKIFSLSNFHPVGIMIYGSANLLQVPWETIIKIYRQKLGEKKFSSLEKYAEDFIRFINKSKRLFPPSEQEKYFKANIGGFFEYVIIRETEYKIEKAIKEKKKITKKEAVTLLAETINNYYIKSKKAKFILYANKNRAKQLKRKYSSLIKKIIKEYFGKTPLSQTHLNQLKEIAIDIFIKSPSDIVSGNDYDSGVVITGFGENDIFPSLISYDVDGIIDNRLVYKQHTHAKIDRDFGDNVAIVPFAQRDDISAFMEGIQPDYKKNIMSYVSTLCKHYPNMIIDTISKLTTEEKNKLKQKMKNVGKTMFEQFIKRFRSYEHSEFISPVTRTVSGLPKDELALMAETFVHLTSFKRRVSEDEETVGGPIDVAVISKGDGFIWIKRKHYFKPELNPQFFRKYHVEEEYNER